MSDLFWLTDEQMERLRPLFPQGHGKPRVPSAIAMHEAGFADGVVATTLGTIWPLAHDRAGVRAACRAPNGVMAVALLAYPEHFSTVEEELRR